MMRLIPFKLVYISGLIFLASTRISFAQSEVVISQYIETSDGSTPKGVEIFNVSGAPITFSTSNNLQIFQGTNGSACSAIINITLGTLDVDEVWVIGTSDLVSNSTINGTDLSGSTPFSIQFNGDDALEVYLGGVIQDTFGTCGSDPGSSWSGGGVTTANNNLELKDGICNGDLDGWTDPSVRFDQISNGTTMTGFGDAPNSCLSVIDPEPTNHPTSFSCITQSADQINLTWTDATGAQLPAGYLIKWSDVSFGDISDPADGSIANGASSITVSQGVESVSITGLDPNTEYFFKIWPYSNSGTDSDYKTSPSPEETTCTTDNGPTCFFTQSFESAGDNWTYTSNQGDPTSGYDLGTDEWTIKNTHSGGLTPTDGSFLWAIRDIENSTYSGDHILEFDQVSVLGYTDLEVSFDWSAIGFDTGDRLEYQLEIDGVWGSVVTACNSCDVGPMFSTESTSIPDGSSTIAFRLIANQNGDSDYAAFDNISICGIAPECVPTHAITSIIPSTGPAGTLVTVSGSGFTGATSAALSGTNVASLNVVDDNTIIIEIPENATSGRIGVTVAGCEALSGQSFALLEDNGTCGVSGGGGSFAIDLLISEVYDAFSGSLSYVEVFNGTNATVDLSADNYVIRIRTGTSTDNDYPMSGNLASGDTYILRLGSSPSTCTNFTPDQDLPLAPGFNGNDRIYLRKNGVDLDYAPNPNHPDAGGSGTSQPGFSQSRNASVTSPTTIYNPSEWTIGTTENCDDLGIPPFVPNAAEITINTQPVDVDCAAVTFSVNATANPGFAGSGGFIWRYLEPGTDTWLPISDLNALSDFTVTGAGTSTISITGNTADLLNYQYYVDLGTSGSPQCRVYSNAAQYTYDSRSFYRAVQTGIWTNPSIWEMSNNESGPYVASCTYPLARNSEKVSITSPHFVTLNDYNLELDQLVIESGGELILTDDAGITLNDGNASGADLEISGTLNDGGSTGGNGVDFNPGATWSIASNGTIIKRSSSSVNNYRDNYDGGIANIQADANWIFRYDGSGEVSVSAINMYYPNLFFETSDPGGYMFNGEFEVFKGGSGNTVVKGNLSIGSTGAGSVEVYMNNFNASPMLIEGDLIIGSGSTFSNDQVATVSQTDDGRGIEVRGDLLIDGILDFQSGLSGEGVLLLSGTGDQLGNGSSSSVFVNELEINKSTGKFLVDFDLIVFAEARFLSGIYETNDLASPPTPPVELIFEDGTATSGMSNSSFVDGNVLKIGSDASFEFPIGDIDGLGNSFYQPLTMFDLPGVSSFRARYFAEAHPNAGDYYDGDSNSPDDFQEIGNCDFWRFQRVSGTNNPRFGVAYTNVDQEYCNEVGAPEFIRISRWNGSEWDEIPSANNANRIDLDDPVQSAADSDYGEFALSGPGAGNLNILPITLLSFRAEAVDGLVHTEWVTATEINNDFFTLERSKDGENWEAAGTVDGAGDSNTELSYAFVDDAPYYGISYYRLRQTDFDGTSTVSDPRAVEIKEGNGFGLDRVYRGQDGLNLVYRSKAPYLTVEIYDMLGKRIHNELLENSGNGFATIYPDLARGAYVLRLSHGGEMDSEKFVY